MAQKEEIDSTLYSRQLYVLGYEAMRRMATSDVLISGLGGLGVEIAKNVILGGLKSVTLHDTRNCSIIDLSSQFYLTEKDINENRALACHDKLAELNNYVKTSVHTGEITEDLVKHFGVVVLTETSLEEQLRISRLTRKHDKALIIADTKGLFGRIFCDFGDEFVVTDTTGENPLSVPIAGITKEAEGVVVSLGDSRHGLADGDYVTFSEIRGMTELNGCEPLKIKSLGPYTFSIPRDTRKFSDYVSGGVATQVKMPTTLKFRSYEESFENPEYVISDFAKIDHPSQIHLAFLTLNEYSKLYGTPPSPWSDKEASRFVELAKKINSERKNPIKETNENLLSIFAKISAGNLAPTNAVIGGIVAQEVMKACSGKFTPIFQYFYFDAIECIPDEGFSEEDARVVDSNRYKGQIAVFGKSLQEKLGSLRYFVVGAGAIGCELLKNFAMMGVGATTGKIYVTDMDLIEKSNLNRQFLFRSGDVRKPKSITAARAIKAMNPDLNVEAHENQVGKNTENIYNSDFFHRLDGVANALDNVNAREYVDSLCVLYQKPLLESGTLGTKGNSQVIVPMLSESYTSSRDPPEKDIPVCTLKNFPNAIEHTLQWARDTFEGLFNRIPQNASQYATDGKFIERVKSQPLGETVEILKSLIRFLTTERPSNFEDCVKWARLLFEQQYNHQIKQLLFNFPPDSTANNGQPFWSGLKKCPRPIEFDKNNSAIVDYVFSAANLRAAIFGIPQNRDRESAAKIAAEVDAPEFKPESGVTIAENEDKLSDTISKNESNDVILSAMMSKSLKIDDEMSPKDDENVDKLIAELPPRNELTSLTISPLQFEKDDDTNFHLDFVVAASNLRASNYGIPAADRYKSKLIAGKIIPAIATTTSIVAGLVCLELYKLSQGFTELARYKNGFLNLAIPFFGFSEPVAASKKKYGDVEWNLWNRIEVEGEMTLREFINHFEQTHGLKITMISRDGKMLFSPYTNQESLSERMDMPVSEVAKLVSTEPIRDTLVFEICCEDAEGNDCEVPFVKYNLPK